MASRPSLTVVISHWYQLLEGLQASSQGFYTLLEAALVTRQIPDASVSRITVSEGGFFSARRLYLRVWRGEHAFDICAAPFGSGFFVSWWLYDPPGCLAWLLGLFGVGPVGGSSREPTYYELDTALMFQEAVHNAVLEVIDQLTQTQGLRRLSGLERRPIWGERSAG